MDPDAASMIDSSCSRSSAHPSQSQSRVQFFSKSSVSSLPALKCAVNSHLQPSSADGNESVSSYEISSLAPSGIFHVLATTPAFKTPRWGKFSPSTSSSTIPLVLASITELQLPHTQSLVYSFSSLSLSFSFPFAFAPNLRIHKFVVAL